MRADKYHPTKGDKLTLPSLLPEEVAKFSAGDCREYERLFKILKRSRRNLIALKAAAGNQE